MSRNLQPQVVDGAVDGDGADGDGVLDGAGAGAGVEAGAVVTSIVASVVKTIAGKHSQPFSENTWREWPRSETVYHSERSRTYRLRGECYWHSPHGED
jgi:hypothetical protein